MTNTGRASRIFAVIAVGASLCGCASGDHFAGRLTNYNIEAEKAQDEAIVLNILRAAQRRPLSFTELQNVTSSGTPSGSVGFGVPLAQNGGSMASTFSPTLSLSGGPTLAAGFINTQDFYQGILKPIPISTIDLFIQRGIPSDLLFNLLFSRVIVTAIPGEADSASPETFTASNDVRSPERLAAYQRLIQVLLNRGLTTGPDKSEPTIVGPPIIDSDLTGADALAKIAGAGLGVKEVDWCALSDRELQSVALRRRFDVAKVRAGLPAQCAVVAKANPHSSDASGITTKARAEISRLLAASGAPLVYRLEKADGGGGFHLCTAGVRSQDGRHAVNAGICDPDTVVAAEPVTTRPRAFSVKIARLPTAEVSGQPPISRDYLCEALNSLAKSGESLDCANPHWDGAGFEVALEPRSTYSVLYYLGEIVRRELPAAQSLDHDAAQPYVMVKLGYRMAAIPYEDCNTPKQILSNDSDYRCDILFYLRPGAFRRSTFLTVHYDGEDYSVPDDAQAGRTNEVLDIVNELIALNHSGKDSPTSSLLTVVGVH